MRTVRVKTPLREIGRLENSSLAVGWFPEAMYPPEDGEQPVPVASVAEGNEYGDRRKGVPMRSFFRTTIHEKEAEWILKTEKMIMGGMPADQVSNVMGAVIRGDIQDKIKSITTPPNSPATIDRKGFDKPLIDSALMLQSISFKVGDQNG